MEIFHFLEEILTEKPSVLHLNMVLLGGFIVFFGLGSLFVKERLYLTEAFCATAFGIAFGPIGLGVVDVEKWVPNGGLSLMMELSR